jgi:alpha-tubulin suppressor-like RCC1 family protein
VNAIIVVVFSEPVDANSVSEQSVRLFRGATPIAGTARVLPGVTAAVVFEPSTTLASNATYRLTVTGAIKDLSGDLLDEPLSVDFTTGTDFVGPVHVVRVTPDTTQLLIGSQVLLTAVGRDSSFTPVIGQPILWSSETPEVASVSPTGLVTAIAEGEARVRAQVGFVRGQAIVIVTRSQLPAASLTLSADSATIPLGPMGGAVRLRAVVRDPAGNTLPFRQVGWTTSDPAIATVTAGSGGKAVISAASPGTTMVIAASEGEADTAAVRVVRPAPYARVVAGGSDPYGGAHTCGVTTDDWVLCWGANQFGQLGNGTPGVAEAPVGVGGTRFRQLATTSIRNCALTPEGAAYCWGDAGLGALGLGTVAAPDVCFALCSETPVAVFGGLRFTAIGVGQAHACALTSSGLAYCWGYNGNGLLGMGVTDGPEDCVSGDGRSGPCSTVPVAVVGGLRFTALAVGGSMGVVGAHTCGITTSGAAYCWGENTFGQLGDGTATHRSAPVPVAGGLSFTALTIGFAHTCGLTTDGSAYCWGWNQEGQLGTGSVTGPESCDYGGPISCSRVPVAVTGALRWAAISAGRHTCGVTPARDAYCWGGSGPQLGTGTTAQITAPAPVAGGLKFATVTAGVRHSCGVTQAGLAYCWGANDTGQLGNGSTLTSAVPVRVAGQQ